MPLRMSWFVSGSVRHLQRRIVADQLAQGVGQLGLVAWSWSGMIACEITGSGKRISSSAIG